MILAGHGGPGLITHAFKCRRLSPAAGRRDEQSEDPHIAGCEDGGGWRPPSLRATRSFQQQNDPESTFFLRASSKGGSRATP